ncbi:metallothiol transferase [Melghirimyces profundicolus]|uniref:Metallothiol transferase n=1 Tax=Melghirimyces profundicolus TaxID=1242148 RepID=A0A2T6C7R3_9BACL|nr:VOC family protein [Melghirimyces profundicolus]PTX64350.1 metallothiol transferase [Melghirimyces profundicolus]
MKVSGFNHVTIRVTDLKASLHFYVEVLGMELVHRGRLDAYLEWGTAWVCLIEREGEAIREENPGPGVDHVAFSIAEEDFDEAVEQLRLHRVPVVRGPVERGGGRVINFLDPDGTQLELNTGDLRGRMKVWV